MLSNVNDDETPAGETIQAIVLLIVIVVAAPFVYTAAAARWAWRKRPRATPRGRG